MTTITLDLPDDLATRLNSVREKLPELLARMVNSLHAGQRVAESDQPINPHIPVYDEVLDFLASGPTAMQIADFKVSPPAQLRVEELLDLNRERGLTEEESEEMNTYLRLNHIMILLKARAYKLLNQAAPSS